MFQPIQRKVKKHQFTGSERENRAEWSTGVAEGSRLTLTGPWWLSGARSAA